MTGRARPDHQQMSSREAAQTVVARLLEAGFISFFAGGCVRDMLLGTEPSDYDVATAAPPELVITLFKRTQKVGAKFGVVLVRIGGHAIEVATFRRDAEYVDGRHPKSVEFTDAREDAIRRDFTINGMFFDPLKNEVVDFVGGQEDLKSCVIRAIGEPNKRFAEDHLRLLRAVRFAGRLNFQIEPATYLAMQAHAAEISRISAERIREELEAILTHPSRARAISQLWECGILDHLWPKADRLRTQRDEITRHLAALPKELSFEAAFATLIGSLSREMIGQSCESLRCSNYTKRVVCWIVEKQIVLRDPEKLTLADLKQLMAHPSFAELLTIYEAGLIGRGLSVDPHRIITERVAAIRPEDVAPPPLLTGHDLEELGIPNGPEYSRILDRAYYMQLNGEINSQAEALAFAQQLMRKS